MDQLTIAIWALAIAVVGHLLSFWLRSPKEVRRDEQTALAEWRDRVEIEFKALWTSINDIRLNGITKTDLRQAITDLRELHSEMFKGVSGQITQLRELVHDLRRASPD